MNNSLKKRIELLIDKFYSTEDLILKKNYLKLIVKINSKNSGHYLRAYSNIFCRKCLEIHPLKGTNLNLKICKTCGRKYPVNLTAEEK